jgi:hypothetical protein
MLSPTDGILLATTPSELAHVSMPAGTWKWVPTNPGPGGDFQGAVAVHPRVKDVAGAVVGDPYQRILRGGLELVAEGDGLERPLNCISEISRSPA